MFLPSERENVKTDLHACTALDEFRRLFSSTAHEKIIEARYPYKVFIIIIIIMPRAFNSPVHSTFNTFLRAGKMFYRKSETLNIV